MKKYTFNGTGRVERPFRAFGLTFAALSLLFCVITPFMGDIPNRWMFLFASFGYSAFFSIFAIGLCLLPGTFRVRVYLFGAAYGVFGFTTSAGILLAARSQRLDLIGLVITPLIWISGTVSFAFVAFAIYGWYFRLAHDSRKLAS